MKGEGSGAGREERRRGKWAGSEGKRAACDLKTALGLRSRLTVADGSSIGLRNGSLNVRPVRIVCDAEVTQ